MAKNKWKPDVWDWTSDPEILKEFDCYSIKHRQGKIWLLVYHHPNTLKYQFVNSQGAHNECSFTSALPMRKNGLSLEEAQAEVLEVVKRYEQGARK